MYQTPELDCPNLFKGFSETESSEFLASRSITRTHYGAADSALGTRRERIDSDDFTFNIQKTGKEDFNHLRQEMAHLKQTHSEEVRPSMKSSVVQTTDSTLLQLEVA